MLIGHVEKRIYDIRKEHPLVIPQIDPDKFSEEKFAGILKSMREMGVQHIAIGGTIVDVMAMQRFLDVAVKDFDFTVALYLTNNGIGHIRGVKGKAAVYWMTTLNSDNLFYLRDMLIMTALHIRRNELEPIPTTYVFDDRHSGSSANWLTRPTLVPRENPDISLSLALTAQYSGSRFYIMGGGSNSKLPPPLDHVEAVSKNTSMFLIPTSGIVNPKHVDELFKAGADAVHVGAAMEKENGVEILKKMIKVSEKYPGKTFHW